MELKKNKQECEVRQPIFTSKNGFLGLQNTAGPSGRVDKNFFLTLNVMISQTIKAMYLNFVSMYAYKLATRSYGYKY
jgi:hypothetical protein